jgi:biopolymer transport protein ExbB
VKRLKAIVPALAIAVAGLLLGSSVARAVESLDELLEQTRNARTDKEKENAQREQEFLANRDLQKSLLAEAKRKRDEAEARSKAMSATFDANELKLAELSDRMDQRVGNLGELFGVVRQVAGDGSAILYNSLLSAQYLGRDAFFADLGKAKELPSIDKLEQLWFEIQREMTESGQVVRFPTEIIDADGKPEERRGRPDRQLHRRQRRPLSELPAERAEAERARPPAGAARSRTTPWSSRRRRADTFAPSSIRRGACCSR